MARTPKLSKRARKFLGRLAAKQVRQITTKIDKLCADPRLHDSETLRGYPGLLRNDQGEFRITYRYTDATLFVILVGKRNDDEVYRALRRYMGR